MKKSLCQLYFDINDSGRVFDSFTSNTYKQYLKTKYKLNYHFCVECQRSSLRCYF